ncbi:hypothetical protein D3C73_398860 [compost metagenome]
MWQFRVCLFALPHAADAEWRIGEPQRAVRLADDVVRRIQLLALVGVGKNRDRAVMLRAGDAAGQVFACNQAALQVAAMAVGIVGIGVEHAPCLVRFVELHDAVVRNIANQQILAVTEIDRTFQPASAGGNLFQRSAGNTVFRKARVENLNGRIGIDRGGGEADRLGGGVFDGDGSCGCDGTECHEVAAAKIHGKIPSIIVVDFISICPFCGRRQSSPWCPVNFVTLCAAI